MKELLEKGDFKKIDEAFLTQSLNVFQDITKIQQKYNKLDTDTFINEVRDSMTAKYLKYTHINIAKHGLDARRQSKNSVLKFDYLEVKTASYDAESWQATFNDTTLEKANLFKEQNIELALSVWRAASELLFIVYGENTGIGNFLEEKVKQFKKSKETVRSTQSISISPLVLKYGFNVYSVNKTPDEIYNLFQIRSGCRKIPRNKILRIEDL
jgi:hypothetical protein